MTDDIKSGLSSLTNYEELSDDVDLNINNSDNIHVDDHSHVPQNLHHASFNSLSLKPELIRAIDDNGFEQPSEVQLQSIPAALLGSDIICQAKSGMGKTAVFVLSVLHLLEIEETPKIRCLVLCHTRELAYQIQQEFNRFKKHFVNKSTGESLVKTKVVLGGTSIQKDKKALQSDVPHIVIGTPGRTLDLIRSNSLNLDHVKYFIIDECDKVLGPNSADMRNDIQTIFYKLPRNKQVLMFSATLDDEVRGICRYFMHNPREIIIDEGKKLRLDGLQQYCIKLAENKKNEKLINILDMVDFNQVFIFVSSVTRANTLNGILNEEGFPTIVTHSGLSTEERIERFKKFKHGSEARIMVSTDLFQRGMDFKSVNVVINYDMAKDEDTYLHRVGRAGRFGTKGLAISFITSQDDENTLELVKKKFVVPVDEMPETIDKTTYR